MAYTENVDNANVKQMHAHTIDENNKQDSKVNET